MQKIYKYRLPRDGQVITIHDNVAEFLHVGAQDGDPTVWAVVDLDKRYKRECEIVAWGTGWDLPDEVWIDCDYIGTCEDGYGYVWHYFARFKDAEPRARTSQEVCGLAADSAISSVDFTVSLDEDALSRILGTTYVTKAVDDFTVTYTNGLADAVCATGVSFARA